MFASFDAITDLEKNSAHRRGQRGDAMYASSRETQDPSKVIDTDTELQQARQLIEHAMLLIASPKTRYFRWCGPSWPKFLPHHYVRYACIIKNGSFLHIPKPFVCVP